MSIEKKIEALLEEALTEGQKKAIGYGMATIPAAGVIGVTAYNATRPRITDTGIPVADEVNTSFKNGLKNLEPGTPEYQERLDGLNLIAQMQMGDQLNI